MREVQASEAKAHLPRLLDEVERGETIVITRHGRHFSPPRGARTPRAVSASASPCSVVAPAFRAAWM